MALERLTEKGRENLRLLEEKKQAKMKTVAMKQALVEFDQEVDANVKKVINNYKRILQLSKLGDAERAALDELSLKVATKEITTAADQLLSVIQDLKLNAELSYSLKGGGFQADGDDDVKMKSEAGNQ